MLFLKILIYLLLFLLVNLLVILLIPLKIRFAADNSKGFQAGSTIYWIYSLFNLKLTYFNPHKLRIRIWLLFFPVIIPIDPKKLINKYKNKKGAEKKESDKQNEEKQDEEQTVKSADTKPESILDKIERIKNTGIKIWDQYSVEIRVLFTKCIGFEMEELSLCLGLDSPDITGYLATFYYILEDRMSALPIYITWDFTKKGVIFNTSFKIRMKLLRIVIILIKFYSKTKKGTVNESE